MVDVLDLDVRPEGLDDQLSLYSTNIHLDSLTLLKLLTKFESEFSIEIDDEAVMSADLVDVGSLVELISSQASVLAVTPGQTTGME